MIVQVRTARPAIMLGGQDYFQSLAPYFLNLSYTDNCDGEKADDLQFQLADRDRRFINDWMPEKGVYVDVQIITERWFAPNAAAIALECGRFWIDTVDFELPAHTVSVKATSIPTDKHIKAGEETRGWEDSSLQDITNQIAEENDMEVDWQSDDNPQYKRIEQTEESGLQFLKNRAKDAKLAIKCSRNKIIVFDEQKYEEAPPAFTLVYGNIQAGAGITTYRMSGGHFATRLVDTMKSCTCAHVNPETGRLIEEKFSTDAADMSGMLWDDKVCENPNYESDEGGGDGEGYAALVAVALAEAASTEGMMANWNENAPSKNAGKGAGGKKAGQRKAKSVVREANKDKETASVELSIGNPLVAAGQTFMLQGVGQFDGKWFIEAAHHTVGPMYTTKLNIRRCLEGY